jgi:hypothetical protein
LEGRVADVRAAILLDQKRSRRSPDLVHPWLEETSGSLDLLRPFERTAGDEMQALIDDPEALADVLIRALQSSQWWIGVGVGTVVEPLPASVRESQGEAFFLARTAIDVAKRRRVISATVMSYEADTAPLEACLWLMEALYAQQTPASRLRRVGIAPTQIESELGITHQAVSKQLKNSFWVAEEPARRLLIKLAGELLG